MYNEEPSEREAHGSNTPQTLQLGGDRAVARDDKMTVALPLILASCDRCVQSFPSKVSLLIVFGEKIVETIY